MPTADAKNSQADGYEGKKSGPSLEILEIHYTDWFPLTVLTMKTSRQSKFEPFEPLID